MVRHLAPQLAMGELGQLAGVGADRGDLALQAARDRYAARLQGAVQLRQAQLEGAGPRNVGEVLIVAQAIAQQLRRRCVRHQMIHVAAHAERGVEGGGGQALTQGRDVCAQRWQQRVGGIRGAKERRAAAVGQRVAIDRVQHARAQAVRAERGAGGRVLTQPHGQNLLRAQAPLAMERLCQGAERACGRRSAGAERHHEHALATGRLPCNGAAARERRVVEVRRQVDVGVVGGERAKIVNQHRSLMLSTDDTDFRSIEPDSSMGRKSVPSVDSSCYPFTAPPRPFTK